MIELWTDGSCNCQQRLGGIGVLIIKNGWEYKINGGFKDTTISRMELWAVIIGLLKLVTDNLQNEKTVVYSDSLYVVNAFNKGWLKGWQRKKFYNVKNSDLWVDVISLVNEFRYLKFVHVKGHSGNKNNEIVDKLANYKNFKEYRKEGEIIIE